MTHSTAPTPPASRPQSRSRSRRGSISILSAVVALALIAVVGLGLDTALVMTARQQLQRSADAAALAAAAKLRDPNETSDYDLTRAAALATAAATSNEIIRCGTSGILLDANVANVDDDVNQIGDVVVGLWRFNSSTFAFEFVATDMSTGLPVPNAVKVRAKCATGSLNSTLELFFGYLFGTNDSNVGRYAIAQQGGYPEPLMLILHRTRHGALTINGGATMDVRAGSIQVDSDHACAFLMNGTSGRMQAQTTRVVGGACLDPLNLQGGLITGAPYVPDPLIDLPAPDPASMTNRGGITGPGTYQPGYYPDGINMNGGTAILQPGIYVIGKNAPAKGIDLKGDAIVRSNPGGVLIYTEPGANLITSGSGSGLDLQPMTSGTYWGVTIFMARTGSSRASIGGGGIFEVEGTFYVPNGELDMHGNVTREVGRIIVDTQTIAGDATYVITGDGLPPPGGPQFVYLVN